MNIKYIIIVMGEPYSTFSEIIGKYFKKNKKFKKKIIIIGNKFLLEKQLKKLNFKILFNEIQNYEQAKKNKINIINIEFKHTKTFANITTKSNLYVKSCFEKFISLSKSIKDKFVLINGPISKKTFLKKKFSGITEYLSNKTNSVHEIMLIYNKELAVSPITTHIPIKNVHSKIKKDKICRNVINLYYFYKNILKTKSKIAILGLNPHCETIDKFSEEDKIIKPSIKYLNKKGIKVDGPFSADTFFLNKNIKKYNLVIGMYRDQVLTPVKTLFNFNAINITVGLPFIRISPDHGPNSEMLGKNISDPTSFFYAMEFIKRI